MIAVYQDIVGAVLGELGDIGVDTAGELVIVTLVDGSVVHVPAGQILGQDVKKDVVFIFDDGFMDASLGTKARDGITSPCQSSARLGIPSALALANSRLSTSS